MMPGTKQFAFAGKIYEVRTTVDGSIYNIRVFLRDKSIYHCSFDYDTACDIGFDVDKVVDIIIDNVKVLLRGSGEKAAA
jgi:hypothetical protein